jgi:hypothetical protein
MRADMLTRITTGWDILDKKFSACLASVPACIYVRVACQIKNLHFRSPLPVGQKMNILHQIEILDFI